MLKIAIIQFILMRQSQQQRRNFFSGHFALNIKASSVFTGYDIGCEHSLQLKNSLKFNFDKHISRKLQRTRITEWK